MNKKEGAEGGERAFDMRGWQFPRNYQRTGRIRSFVSMRDDLWLNMNLFMGLCQVRLSLAHARIIRIFIFGLAEAVHRVKMSITGSGLCTILHLPLPLPGQK